MTAPSDTVSSLMAGESGPGRLNSSQLLDGDEQRATSPCWRPPRTVTGSVTRWRSMTPLPQVGEITSTDRSSPSARDGRSRSDRPGRRGPRAAAQGGPLPTACAAPRPARAALPSFLPLRKDGNWSSARATGGLPAARARLRTGPLLRPPARSATRLAGYGDYVGSRSLPPTHRLLRVTDSSSLRHIGVHGGLPGGGPHPPRHPLSPPIHDRGSSGIAA